MTEDGYYWLIEKDCDPAIVEIIGDSMLMTGDKSFYKEDGVWRDLWDTLDIVSLIGPLNPPDA